MYLFPKENKRTELDLKLLWIPNPKRTTGSTRALGVFTYVCIYAYIFIYVFIYCFHNLSLFHCLANHTFSPSVTFPLFTCCISLRQNQSTAQWCYLELHWLPIPVAQRSMEGVCGRSLAGIAGSNVVCCHIKVSAIVRDSHITCPHRQYVTVTSHAHTDSMWQSHHMTTQTACDSHITWPHR